MAARNEPLQMEDLWLCRELLIRLIFHIPAVEAQQHSTDHEVRRIDSEEYGRAMKRFSCLPFNYYRVVFDPHDFDAVDEPVTGMLADDLSDIYRDLAEGVDSSRMGQLGDACFAWAQSYAFHWARHAVNALTAIEIYRTNNHERVEQAVASDGQSLPCSVTTADSTAPADAL